MGTAEIEELHSLEGAIFGSRQVSVGVYDLDSLDPEGPILRVVDHDQGRHGSARVPFLARLHDEKVGVVREDAEVDRTHQTV
jgi:hypothetical protein